MTEVRQEPTPRVRFNEVSVKRELTVQLRTNSNQQSCCCCCCCCCCLFVLERGVGLVAVVLCWFLERGLKLRLILVVWPQYIVDLLETISILNACCFAYIE